VLRRFWGWFRDRLWGALDLAAWILSFPKWMECPAPGCVYAVLAEEAGYRAWRVTVVRPYRGKPRLIGGWPRCPQHGLPLRVR
jgi:hypothetical protein